MDADRWATVERLFHEALALPATARDRFLTEACGADAVLRQEVASLLAGSAGHAVEALPAAAAAAWLEDADAATLQGRVIGPYRVGARLGAGGMGQVYAAEDVRLGRPIALKLLRAALGADPERVRRFEAEARAASALNHPNIITIYDIGVSGDRPFIVTELVDGETLRERLRRGRLPVDEAVDVMRQIAAALDVAHRAGIVHRDVKPENIMVRRDGYAKLLDFGVAKLAQPEPAVAGADAGPSSPAQTQFGARLGTPAYMSPEQAAGGDVDPRVDLFALGVVGYEMVAGRRPFEGMEIGAPDANVGARVPPSLVDLDPTIPPRFAAIVARALERTRDRRYASAAALLHDLDELRRARDRGDTGAEPDRAARRPSPRTMALAAAAALAAIAIAAVVVARVSRRPSLDAASSSFFRLTDDAGNEMYPNLSPDGRWCAYAAMAHGVWDIYRKPIAGGEAVNLTRASAVHGTMPAFSPDGRRIAFMTARQSGGIAIVDADGSHAAQLTDSGGNPSWLPDGKQIIYASEPINEPNNRSSISHLAIVDVDTRVSRPLATGDAVQPQVSPHGLRVAYWGSLNGRRDIWTVALAGGAPVAVTDDLALDWGPVWAPDGRAIYFLSDRGGSMNVWRVGIDEQSGAVQSAPQPITTPATYAKHLSASADGTRLAYVQSANRAIVRKLAFDPDRAEVVGSPSTVVERSLRTTDATVSPDGQWLAFSSEGEIKEEIFVARADGSGIRALMSDAAVDRLPDWSPDGSRVAFYSNRTGHFEIWSIRPDGSGLTQVSDTTRLGVNTPVWAPDGYRIAYHEAGRTWIKDLRGGAADLIPPMPNATSGFTTWNWTPDGSGLLGWTNSPNLKGVHAYSFATRRYERLTTTGFAPVWLRDGHRFLFLSDPGALYLWDDTTREARELFHGDRVDRFSLPRDNRSIYYTALSTEGDVWIMTISRAY